MKRKRNGIQDTKENEDDLARTNERQIRSHQNNNNNSKLTNREREKKKDMILIKCQNNDLRDRDKGEINRTEAADSQLSREPEFPPRNNIYLFIYFTRKRLSESCHCLAQG